MMEFRDENKERQIPILEETIKNLNRSGSFIVQDTIIFHAAGALNEYQKWATEIPFIEFPVGWRVQITPPFGGAVVRFRVWIPGMPAKDSVSIYLDCYNRLGFGSGPYWEVYPHQGDTFRCGLNDINELIAAIADRSERPEEEDKESDE